MSINAAGTLRYTRIGEGELSMDAQLLVLAIDDQTVTVNITADNSKEVSPGVALVGGAFMGNTVTVAPDGTATAVANQRVNPSVLATLSNTYNQPGADMLHETTEAYQGGLLSIGKGTSSPAADEPNSIYQRAHDAARPQSGPVYQTLYDGDGNVIPNYPAARGIFSARPVGGPLPVVIIMQYP